MRIALVAGEASGDLLGARLILELKKHYPNARFEGIGGKEMLAAGLTSLFEMERLSVIGLTEVLSRLRELLWIRKSLKQRWAMNPPDLLVGIDAPDFNIPLERYLHQQGVKVVHYVSPSIWAWRQSRVKRFAGNLHHMLTLFPFEVDFYRQHNVPATFVGHPLADEVPLESDQSAARKLLVIPDGRFVLGVLPGSRMGEIQRIGPVFLAAMQRLREVHTDWMFVVPLVNDKVATAFRILQQQLAPELPILFIDGQSREVMAAADQMLMASGTAVLEGMLVNRPMVAAYRIAPVSGWIIQGLKMIKSPYYTLPNNLANECLVPEYIQGKLTVSALVEAVEQQFNEPESTRAYRRNRFTRIHRTLRKNASESAALALVGLLGGSDLSTAKTDADHIVPSRAV